MPYRFYTADVFTDQLFGGNPLAVFPDAQGLSAEQMQRIAREFNLSETVFVLPPERPEHTRRLRIFTPKVELPFAGHPTVGTAFVLAAIGEVPLNGEETRIVLEEGVGPVSVRILAREGKPVFSELTAAQAPEFGPEPPSTEELAAVLSLSPEDIDGEGLRPQAVSCGVSFLFVPLRSLGALERSQLDRVAWQKILSGFWAPDVYPFCLNPTPESYRLRARLFAPGVGIEEDPATGSAAAALGGYLGVRDPLSAGTRRWQVEQGVEMGRPSLLQVEFDKQGGQVVAIRVGGSSVLVSEGNFGFEPD